MSEILVEHEPSPMKLEVLGVEDWVVCAHEIGELEKTYSQTTTAFVISGQAILATTDGGLIQISENDLVTFMPGASCIWRVAERIEYHCSQVN